jgi:hypothetical protein
MTLLKALVRKPEPRWMIGKCRALPRCKNGPGQETITIIPITFPTVSELIHGMPKELCPWYTFIPARLRQSAVAAIRMRWTESDCNVEGVTHVRKSYMLGAAMDRNETPTNTSSRKPHGISRYFGR